VRPTGSVGAGTATKTKEGEEVYEALDPWTSSRGSMDVVRKRGRQGTIDEHLGTKRGD